MLFFPRKGITLPRIFCCLLFCRLFRMPFLPLFQSGVASLAHGFAVMAMSYPIRPVV